VNKNIVSREIQLKFIVETRVQFPRDLATWISYLLHYSKLPHISGAQSHTHELLHSFVGQGPESGLAMSPGSEPLKAVA
jgi:hypothetical protein